jgi:beta-phosphoglucomutase-like phosphatase (HAD superfamily)
MTSATRFTVDAILYDMDGTLVDSTPAAEYTYAKLCEEHGIENKGHAHVG